MSEDAIGDSALFAPIEPYVFELATSRKLPALAVALCTLRYPASGPLLRASLELAAEGNLADDEDALLFFRALHIVGGRRDPLGFDPLLRFLRRSGEEVEDLLGDAITQTLPCIVAGVFDGNADALFDAIVDLRIDEFVRDALLGAATFLSWEGRIERRQMIRFLERFDSERLASDADMTWYGWTKAIGMLGLRSLEAAVAAAFDRGSIPPDLRAREDFTADLADAERAPDDIGRFKRAYLGYIDDVLEVLERFDTGDEQDEFLRVRSVLPRLGLPAANKPAENPWRDVGRNDPCPCGSGKKAKRCCLAA